MKLLNAPRMMVHPGIKLIPTEEDVVKIELREKKFFYDANVMALWEVEEDEWRESDETTVGMRTKPFIDGELGEMSNKHLVLQTTYACNLKCRYCFVREHYTTKKNMLSFDDAQRAINNYQDSNKRCSISFFGGEPLLNWEVIKRASDYVFQRTNGNAHCHITSNGTLVTEEIAEYCAEKRFSWIISVDGPEDMHNANRPYCKVEKGSSHADTLQGLEKIVNAYKKRWGDNYEMPITLRATYDQHNPQVLESLKYLNDLMYKGFAGHVSVESSSLGEGCTKSNTKLESLTNEELYALLGEKYWEAADWFLQEIREGRKPSFHHFEMPLQRLYDRDPAFTECGASKGYLSVGPGGKISACHRENLAEIGTLNHGVDPVQQAKWLDNRYFVRTTCNTCWRRNACGGGCRHDSLQDGNPISVPCRQECTLKDIYTKPVVWLLSEMTEEQKKMYSKHYRPKEPQQKKVCNDPNCGCKNNHFPGPQQQGPPTNQQKTPRGIMEQVPISADIELRKMECNEKNCGCNQKKPDSQQQ